MPRWNRSPSYKSSKNGETGRYRYREWLSSAQTYQFCAYCLVYQDLTDVEHHVPKAYCKTKKTNPDRPQNLLLACQDCNDLKWDYHPSLKKRKAGRNLKSRVLNPFTDDLKKFYRLKTDGALEPIKKSLLRSTENCALFAHDTRQKNVEIRAMVLLCIEKFHEQLKVAKADDLLANPDFEAPIKMAYKNRKLLETFSMRIPKDVQNLFQKAKKKFNLS